MILSCNSCEKKFVVPDSAITAEGRLVQCSSCGNKWKQFPINNEKTKPKEKISEVKSPSKEIQNISKKNKKKIKRKTGPNLYSPEYLAKKHGIKIDSRKSTNKKLISEKVMIKFGFYNFLVVSIIVVITILRLLYFGEDFIVKNAPILEIYIDYLFESIKNIMEIIKNFFSSY